MKSSINASKVNNKENESAKPKPPIESLKSDYFLQKLFYNMLKKKKLEIVKYNKKIQNRINLSVKDYKEYSERFSSIEVEIIPTKDEYGEFIYVNKNDKLYYHIYFNDGGEDIKNKYFINKEDKVKKIKIIIDYQVKSFKALFKGFTCIESIIFKKFIRNNIIDMSWMFAECSSLKEMKFINFNTNYVENMKYMFIGCSSLKELNLSYFNNNNVKNMSFMFYGCSSLKELNLSKFNTNNVKDMSSMFNGCSSLKELNLNNFNTNNVKFMSNMFQGCTSLKHRHGCP